MSVDRKAFRFFLENAGYVSPSGRAACALELARAESLLIRASDLGVASVEWVDDDMPYDRGDVDSPEDVARYFESGRWTGPFGCVLRVNGEHAESLWGIVVGPEDTSDPYCRVVAAELACEIEDDLRQAVGDALDALEVSHV